MRFKKTKHIDENDICYLCGKKPSNPWKELELDHLPPKFLSPKSTRLDFAYVPACPKCNRDYSHQENIFRDFITTGVSKREKNQSATDSFEAMRRKFKQNEIGRAGKPHKDLLRLINNIKQHDRYTKSGLYIGTVHKLHESSGLDSIAILIKIARGLHYLHTGKYIPDSYKVGAKFMEKIEFPEVFNELKIGGRTGDFFHFKGGWTKEDDKTGVWYMSFYKEIGAMAWFLKPELSKTSKVYNE